MSTNPANPADPAAQPASQGSVKDLLQGLVQEARDYLRNLGRLAGAEMREQTRALRILAAMAGAAVLLLLLGLLLLTLALVDVIAYGLGSWGWALLIVGVGYSLIGLLLIATVGRRLRKGLMRFEHTRRRLREDAAYVKTKLAA